MDRPGRLDFLSMSYPRAQKTQIPTELRKKPDGAMLTLAANSIVFFTGGTRAERTDRILGIPDAEKTPVWTLSGRRVPVPAPHHLPAFWQHGPSLSPLQSQHLTQDVADHPAGLADQPLDQAEQ